MTTRQGVLERYRSYLQACNRRDWPAVAAHVADVVVVNAMTRTRAEYVADIQATLAVFPDYRWELRQAVVESQRIAVHLRAGGTRTRPFLGAPGDGTVVTTDEFVIYRFAAGLIREVSGTADNARLTQRPDDEADDSRR